MEQIMNQPIIIPNDMSPSLANLLMKMLNKDPNSRLTVNEVLSHPWVNQTSIQKKIHTNEVSIVNHDVILKMVEKGYSREIIIKKLLDEVVDDDTITYKILKRQIINEKMFNKSPNNSSIISDKTTKSLLTLNTIMNSKHNFSYINNNFRRGMVLRDNKQQTSIHFGNQVSLNNSNRFFHSTTRLIKLETMKGPT
ncbi:hypothetical protein TRFO_31717 [Tritrichomonas foetus]|uniref:Protein kinase domain-containing protein n=1 Tax=Tritrichomonas foetus TaxID=1144522 RepID=A0A1J4JV96_9EUKA|nr:hypothetical protein TRFO_31717 [Tritrichomonas foetus]|eukprot:OHT01452.1 hypothetical protein TRFO_31717 [Tritrichomonas foetus]